jgi:hypothetical protein
MTSLEESVEQLFGEVVDLAPELRPAFLGWVCEAQPVPQRMVESRPQENKGSEGFPYEPPLESSRKDRLAWGMHFGDHTITEPLRSGSWPKPGLAET